MNTYQLLHYDRRCEIMAMKRSHCTWKEFMERFGNGATGKTRKVIKWHLKHIRTMELRNDEHQ